MAEDTRLVNIYLKIHNKQPLFIDDLRYLAKYDPECFEKTCKNVVHNIPETRLIMEPVVEPKEVTGPRDSLEPKQTDSYKENGSSKEPVPVNATQAGGRASIEAILDNLKRLEKDEVPVSDMDAEKVKNLLGNLFMEQIFPHNDRNTFMEFQPGKKTSFFDKKA